MLWIICHGPRASQTAVSRHNHAHGPDLLQAMCFLHMRTTGLVEINSTASLSVLDGCSTSVGGCLIWRPHHISTDCYSCTGAEIDTGGSLGFAAGVRILFTVVIHVVIIVCHVKGSQGGRKREWGGRGRSEREKERGRREREDAEGVPCTHLAWAPQVPTLAALSWPQTVHDQSL